LPASIARVKQFTFNPRFSGEEPRQEARDGIAGFLQAFGKMRAWRRRLGRRLRGISLNDATDGFGARAAKSRSVSRCSDAARDADAALFSIRLHSVRKERIGVAQISPGEFLTRRLFAPVRACTARKNK
jgi:hypothetical protein